MLALSRKLRESIVITVPPSPEPQKIVVLPLLIEAGRVRLGISAAPEVIVNRSEVQNQIDAGRPAPKPQPEK